MAWSDEGLVWRDLVVELFIQIGGSPLSYVPSALFSRLIDATQIPIRNSFIRRFPIFERQVLHWILNAKVGDGLFATGHESAAAGKSSVQQSHRSARKRAIALRLFNWSFENTRLCWFKNSLEEIAQCVQQIFRNVYPKDVLSVRYEQKTLWYWSENNCHEIHHRPFQSSKVAAWGVLFLVLLWLVHFLRKWWELAC